MSDRLSAERIAEIKSQAEAAKRKRLAAGNGDRFGVEGAEVEVVTVPPGYDWPPPDEPPDDEQPRRSSCREKPAVYTPKNNSATAQPRSSSTMDEPDGAALLDELHTTIKRYVVFPDEHSSVATTLWIAATHALPAFECAPRLVFTSPQKRCAKSRTLDIIAGICHQALATSDATVAAIFRSIGGDHPPTLIIDEADCCSVASAAPR